MKKIIIIYNYFLKRIIPVIIISGISCGIIAAAPAEKRTASIQLSYYKKAGEARSAVAIVKAKNSEGKFIKVKNTRINFYVQNAKDQQLLETAYTDNGGKAEIVLLKNLPVDTGHYFTIIAKIENDSVYEDEQEQMHYKDATIAIRLNEQDTNRLATVVVTTRDKENKKVVVKNAEVKFYIQRLFGLMPVAEDYTAATDENGEASIAVPKSIPGDTNGSITIVARIEDNEQFGNVENKVPAVWGRAVVMEKDPFPRALWEPYAPLPLILTIAILFGGVWTTYSIIFFTLYKIKKAGKVAS